MKKYIKPVMEGELFVANEFIATCGGVNGFSCLNMNYAKKVYVDSDKDGILDSNESELTGITNIEWHDCDTDGDSSAGNHKIDKDNLSNYTWVLVKFNGSNNLTSAILDDSVKKDSPHFISIKTINNS